MGIAYRPEIDGLRAIAVLAVIAYHAGLGGAGFVGVDVFFVISGYLITALLLREREATGRIDLLAFYARRVRRIVPAAAVVVLAVLAASSMLLSATDQVHTAWSAAAALVFAANVFFQFTAGGYFDGAAGQMPLLHLWSLSVEEQFYFLWPALLLLVRNTKATIIGLGLASFLLAQWLPAEAAFYQMPARFWELVAGGMVAAMPQRALPRWAAPVGVLVTLAACTYPLGHFPGVGALPAVAGAWLVIAAVHGGATNRVLRSRPMVWVGLISYSLYLWHWPLLAFYRATVMGDGDLPTRLVLCAIAFPLAFASYRYVEQPIRRMRWRKGRTVAIGFGASAVVALSACAYGVQTHRADMGEFPLATQAGRDYPNRSCHYQGTDTAFPKCPPPEEATAAIWGDSMAYAWTPLVEDAAAHTRDACPPLVGVAISPKCDAFNAKVAQRVRGMEAVYLVARWRGDLPDGLGRTLAGLAQVPRVVVLGPTPEMRDEVPDCIRSGTDCGITRAQFDETAQPVLARLRKAAKPYPNVEVVDLTDHFCTASHCPPVKDGMPLYWDSHHVTVSAARRFSLQLD